MNYTTDVQRERDAWRAECTCGATVYAATRDVAVEMLSHHQHIDRHERQ